MSAVIGLRAYDFRKDISFHWGVRQDLSPPETSQIIRVFPCHKAIGDEKILQRIIVKIHRQ